MTIIRDGDFLRNGADSVRVEWVAPRYLDDPAAADWGALVRDAATRLYDRRIKALAAAAAADWQRPVAAGAGAVRRLTYPPPPGYLELVLDKLFGVACQATRPDHAYLPVALATEGPEPALLGSEKALSEWACAHNEQIYPCHRAFLEVLAWARRRWRIGGNWPGLDTASTLAERVTARGELHDADLAARYRTLAARSLRELLPANRDEARQYAREAIERAAAREVLRYRGLESMALLAALPPTAGQAAAIAGTLAPLIETHRGAVAAAASAAAAYQAMDTALAAIAECLA